MHDVLPDAMHLWHKLEGTVRNTFAAYGFSEIRIPVVEKTELFARAIGAATDVVEKEMYTFEDRNGDSLSLRPEGTAGVVRAVLQNGLLYGSPQGGPASFTRSERKCLARQARMPTPNCSPCASESGQGSDSRTSGSK